MNLGERVRPTGALGAVASDLQDEALALGWLQSIPGQVQGQLTKLGSLICPHSCPDDLTADSGRESDSTFFNNLFFCLFTCFDLWEQEETLFVTVVTA